MRLTDYDHEEGRWVAFSDNANNVRRHDLGQWADNPAAVHASQFMPGAELTVTDAGRGVVELPGTVCREWALHPGADRGGRSACRYRVTRQPALAS
jgi:hypothetical protein